MTRDAKRKHARLQTTALAARLFAASIICGAALAAAIAPTTAQNYPDKPIRIIVAAAAGGPSDFPARLAAQILSPKLGQPVVVENRAGAGGAIGAREVAKAKPDGYTLLVGNTSTMAVIPAVSESAGYDPVKDFAPIAKITEGFQILVVHPSSPWKTLKDFVDYAKANPGKINYAHTGGGGLPHLAGELFLLRSGTKLTGVSYRSGGESNAARPQPGGARDLREHRHPRRADPRRKVARARGAKRASHAAAARCADHGGSGLPGRRGLHLLRTGRTGRHARCRSSRGSTGC